MIKTVFTAAALATVALAAPVLAQDHSGHSHGQAANAQAPAPRPTIESPIKDLLDNPETAAVMEKHLPGVANHPMRPQFEGMTLGQVAPVSGGAITPELIARIDADLKALPAA